MSLFGLGKKKEETTKTACCCNSSCEVKEPEKVTENIKNIKVLGAGCASCHKQYENVREAVSDIGLDVEIEYITDMEKVMTYGVMSMPAIVVNDKVVSMGKVLKVSEVERLLIKQNIK